MTGPAGPRAAEAPAGGGPAGSPTPIEPPRRLGVLGLLGEPTPVTVALLLGAHLARSRPDGVLVFGTHDGPGADEGGVDGGDLVTRAAVVPAATAHDLATLGDPGGLDALIGSVRRGPGGAWILPGHGPGSGPLTMPVYVAAMNAVFRRFPYIVTACPPTGDNQLTQQVLRGCHSVVLLSGATAPELAVAQGVLDRWEAGGYPGLAATSVVVVLGRAQGRAGRAAAAAARARLATVCHSVHPVAPDPALIGGGPLDPGRVRRRTASALTRITAAVTAAARAAG